MYSAIPWLRLRTYPRGTRRRHAQRTLRAAHASTRYLLFGVEANQAGGTPRATTAPLRNVLPGMVVSRGDWRAFTSFGISLWRPLLLKAYMPPDEPASWGVGYIHSKVATLCQTLRCDVGRTGTPPPTYLQPSAPRCAPFYAPRRLSGGRASSPVFYVAACLCGTHLTLLHAGDRRSVPALRYIELPLLHSTDGAD